jgi:LAS superfamily LD-carboxypeptidase LdcB
MKHCIFLIFPFFLSCQPATDTGQQATQTEVPVDAAETALSEKKDTTDLAKARAMGFDTQYLMGQFDPARHPDFVEVPARYADREGLLLRKDTYEAFLAMYEAAQADGIQLVIRSATRNFNYQKGIWERKWTGQRKLSSGENAAQAFPDPKERALEILKYSSMPGTSRHHWGTDIDLNAFNNRYFEEGQGQKIYAWLTAHAPDFGFCQPYSPKGPERPNGYNEEKWHWSYLPVAQPLTALAREELQDRLISGFEGANTATDIQVVDNYVLGISNLCIGE